MIGSHFRGQTDLPLLRRSVFADKRVITYKLYFSSGFFVMICRLSSSKIIAPVDQLFFVRIFRRSTSSQIISHFRKNLTPPFISLALDAASVARSFRTHVITPSSCCLPHRFRSDAKPAAKSRRLLLALSEVRQMNLRYTSSPLQSGALLHDHVPEHQQYSPIITLLEIIIRVRECFVHLPSTAKCQRIAAATLPDKPQK